MRERGVSAGAGAERRIRIRVGMQKRLEDLEIKVAFQEHTIAELDGVIQQLAKDIERLARQLRELQEEHAASREPPINEKPPHY